jgi:site-specific DNA recombinase
VHAMRRAGRWVGGAAPYGYDLVQKRLVVNATEAENIRWMHKRYLELGCCNKLVLELRERGVCSKQFVTRNGIVRGGVPAKQSFIYGLLGNPTYLGQYHVGNEVIEALHDPIVDRETWSRVRDLKDSRRLKRSANSAQTNLLIDLLFDEYGRKMVIWSGANAPHLTSLRFYLSTSNHKLTKSGVKSIRAEANDLETLIRAAVCSFFRTRVQVSDAIHALGYRDADSDKLIALGDLAARHLETFDRRRLRRAWEALIERIDVSRERVRIILRCDQIRAFLGWPGTGLFKPAPNIDAKYHRIYIVEAEAFVVRSERKFRLPIDTGYAPGKPKRDLLKLMSLARRAQTLVYEHRTMAFEEIARTLHCREAYVMRALRLNYLAPDIISAIVDGRQPADLTRTKLLNSSIPMDWAQQRVLFGFPPRQDPRGHEERY